MKAFCQITSYGNIMLLALCLPLGGGESHMTHLDSSKTSTKVELLSTMTSFGCTLGILRSKSLCCPYAFIHTNNRTKTEKSEKNVFKSEMAPYTTNMNHKNDKHGFPGLLAFPLLSRRRTHGSNLSSNVHMSKASLRQQDFQDSDSSQLLQRNHKNSDQSNYQQTSTPSVIQDTKIGTTKHKEDNNFLSMIRELSLPFPSEMLQWMSNTIPFHQFDSVDSLIQHEQPINISVDNNITSNANPDKDSSIVSMSTSSMKNDTIRETESDGNDLPKMVHITHKSNVKHNETNKTKKLTVLHKYHHPEANITLYGLSLSLPKFKAWITYMLQRHETFSHPTSSSASFILDMYEDNKSQEVKDSKITQYISTEKIQIDAQRRKELRYEWFARRLISDRTEILASYPSNQINEQARDSHENKKNGFISHDTIEKQKRCLENDDVKDKANNRKRGGFDDLLRVHADRLVSLVFEEERDMKLTTGTLNEDNVVNVEGKQRAVSALYNDVKCQESSFVSNDRINLVQWLQSTYGDQETSKLFFSNFSIMTEKEKMVTLQHFLYWFKEKFPYYYDRCDRCHASFREDNSHSDECNQDNKEDDEDASSDESKDDKGGGTFVGYVFPSIDEVEGKASRTELYHCHKCQAYTRFPRFNSIPKIVRYGRGRCGEYSILLYRILRDLGHQTRWVVDWSDHVWVECWIDSEGSGGRWVHLDPCEAACDQPFLYQDWGKKQTIIIAFWLPQERGSQALECFSPFIEDVTSRYTTDYLEVIQSRREESIETIQKSIKEVEASLRNKLYNVTA